jgi:hypothetical protein
MLGVGPVLVTVLLLVLGLAVLYVVIRLAVSHAIEDAGRRRGQPAYPAPKPPAAPAGRPPAPPAGD